MFARVVRVVALTKLSSASRILARLLRVQIYLGFDLLCDVRRRFARFCR